ncbi:hypothetical protein AB205_0077340 [Aquarana catesbeiana]|uniref:Uncharacterized protein n=1 Tax=Aquarana catesbeiana TaxID=8400 RepID=A0A2G9S634_AQUCT|nr:hypothetical protein AB205_0077340 [Aquarana catesbeiana]
MNLKKKPMGKIGGMDVDITLSFSSVIARCKVNICNTLFHVFFFKATSFSCLALLLNFVNNPSISLEHVTLFFNKSHIFYQQFFTFSVNHNTPTPVREPVSKPFRLRSGRFPDLMTCPSIWTFLQATIRDLKQQHWHAISPNLNNSQTKAIKSLKKRSDIVIKQSDKGGNIVLMTHSQYQSMCLTILNNRNCYRSIPQSLVSTFTSELRFDHGQIPFLELSIIKQPDGTLGNDLYRKPTAGNTLLHATSAHPKPLNKFGPFREPDCHSLRPFNRLSSSEFTPDFRFVFILMKLNNNNIPRGIFSHTWGFFYPMNPVNF